MTTRVQIGERRPSHDMLCVSTPTAVRLDDNDSVAVWGRMVVGIAKQYCWKQYERRPPFDIEFEDFKVVITSSPEEVRAFYAENSDGCEHCKEGEQLALAYFAVEGAESNPNVTVTLLRTSYTEVW